MKKNLFKIVIGIGIAAAFASCTSMSTMQTARTTEEGEFGYSSSVGYVSTEMDVIDTVVEMKAPILDMSIRYGITEKLDVGAKLTIIGTSGIDVKYQFLGDKESLVAGAVGLGYGSLTLTSGDYKTGMHDIMVPTYFSFHPAEWFSIYASPKYVLRIVSSKDNSTGVVERGSSHWYGSTIGCRIGKTSAFLMEYSYFANSKVNNPFGQFNMGVCVNF